MRVVITLEHRFRITPDGRVWSKVMFPYSFWTRYLDVFDEVLIVARALPVDVVDEHWKLVTGEGVKFLPIPYFHGPVQYAKKFWHVRRAVRQAYSPNSAFVLRVGSRLGRILMSVLCRNKHPFGVEVVGDPWDVFSPGAFRHPLRPYFRLTGWHGLRRTCRQACAVAYVTEHALQRRYPADSRAFVTNYSSVELPPEAFAASPRVMPSDSRRIRLIAVGTLDSYYKGPDILVDAVALCIGRGVDLELVWVGDGVCRSDLESRVQTSNATRRVEFLGQLPAGNAVRAELDKADLFVLPSRQEGVPRAVIEAMARGLPCIGSQVGGFSELLPDQCLVPPNNVKALTGCIQRFLASPDELRKQSERNLLKASEFRDEILRKRRRKFYQFVLEKTKANITN